MPDKIQVLVAPPPEPGLARRLARRSRLRIVAPPPERWREALGEAEILVTRTVHAVDETLLRAAPRLRAVVQASAGLDNIDTVALERRGIALVGVDPGNAAAVAEMTLLSLIALARRVRERWDELASGRWPDRDAVPGCEIGGASLGIVGLGRIGSRVARLAGAFGMKVRAVDPYVPRERFDRFGAERAASLEELLSRSRFLSLHCPLTEETRRMIDGRRLDLMPEGAFLVNTARGAIVDEPALLARLDRGRIAGAALDVFRGEPAPDRRLLAHPAVLPTPHIAGHTAESRRRRLENLARAVVTTAEGLARRPGA